ncbi:MAG: VWA domain-containing protein [Geminicoccaceae bacterium]
MHRPNRQSFDVLSISALDIFASALGVFILMAILMFPYYLKQPSLEQEQEGAEAELVAAGVAKSTLTQAIADAEAEGAEATAELEAAKTRLTRAAAAAKARPKPIAPKPSQLDNPLFIDDLDLVVVLDTTKSMKRELADLQANLIGVIRVLHRLAASLRVGLVAFKDRGDEYLTRAFPLRGMNGNEVRAITDFLKRIEAEGGGDRPEPVDTALQVAIDMAWRSDAQGRIILVGDAEPRERQRALELAGSFRASAGTAELPRVVSSIFTGDHPGAAGFYEKLAEVGGGEASIHQGRMIESVLLSILPDKE